MNKPVAWMHKNPEYAISKHRSLEFNIPLYTHPAKELTDDEIFKEMEFLPSSIAITEEDLIKFAKAILRKAQEK